MEEIFRLVEREIQASNFADVLGSGVVISGGTALLPGVAELGEDVLGLPVRIGFPRAVGGLHDLVNSPVFATALGLVMQGAAEEADQAGEKARASNRTKKSGKNPKIFEKFFDWVRAAF